MWTKSDEERRLCLQWLKEPLINPETGKSIKRNGPTFIEWQQRCKEIGLQHKPRKTGDITYSKHKEWVKQPDINPDTGRKIKIGGPTFQKLVKIKLEKQNTILGEYFKPDTKGMVPCIKHNDSFYVIRKYGNRYVWGYLNKPAIHIGLVYYKDTFDYKNNLYKPIFIGKKPEKPKGNLIRGKDDNDENVKYLVDGFLGKLF